MSTTEECSRKSCMSDVWNFATKAENYEDYIAIWKNVLREEERERREGKWGRIFQNDNNMIVFRRVSLCTYFMFILKIT